MSPYFTDPILDHLHQQVTDHFGELLDIQPALPQDYFWNLCRSIVGQQLSEKVAPIIVERVKITLGHHLTPESVLNTPDELLRAAGLSYAKISYLKNTARAWQEVGFSPEKLSTLSDEEVITVLTQIKGVGRWTAEMFLLFTLARPDIFSVGDYGLKRAMMLSYHLPLTTQPAQFLELATLWSPYRSLASRVLWKSLDLL